MVDPRPARPPVPALLLNKFTVCPSVCTRPVVLLVESEEKGGNVEEFVFVEEDDPVLRVRGTRPEKRQSVP